MKKAIFTLAIAALGFTAGAQDKGGSDKTLKFSIGATAGLPIGTLGNIASLAYGGDLQGEYAASEQVGITLSAGYIGYVGKSGFSIDGVIPVLAGARISFAENVYGSLQAGMSFGSGGSAFTYAPGIGYKVSENFDVLLKYQAASKGGTSSFVGLRAAYNF